jgi:hypothetical protein
MVNRQMSVIFLRVKQKNIKNYNSYTYPFLTKLLHNILLNI